MKSPGFTKALQPLRRLQADFHAKHENDLENHKARIASAEYAEKLWKEECRKAAKANRDMPARPVAAEPPDEPTLQRLLTGDTTQEALVDLIKQNPRGLL